MLNYDIDLSCQLPRAVLAGFYDRYFPDKIDGVFVEVGAFDGIFAGHVFSLAKLGWRGLCIEPHPEYARQCAENHAGHNVAVETCAVGDKEGAAPLYVYLACSSMKVNDVTLENGINPLYAIQVPVRRLDNILAQHKIPEKFDVISIDVEEAEMEVLAGFDLRRWLPKMAIVETHETDPNPARNWKGVAVGKVFADAGYEKIYADHINTIYVRE